jgi:hypothetical protein
MIFDYLPPKKKKKNMFSGKQYSYMVLYAELKENQAIST